MIRWTKGDLLQSDAEALVNTVNTVGVMGKGVALQFRDRFTENYRLYQEAVKRGEVRIGKMFVTKATSFGGIKWIVNFPTKQHWKSRSRIEDVALGLDDLVNVIREKGIKSIAIPPLGCGNGGLNWDDVKPLIEEKLRELPDVNVLVFEPGWIVETKVTDVEVKLTKPLALILNLIQRYTVLGFEVTHLEIQKLAYFLVVFGQPNMRLRYGKGQYGPFAPNLRFALQKLEGTFLRGDTRVADARPLDTIVPILGKQNEVDEFLKKNLDHDESERLKRISQLIEGFESPFGLELLATVFWVVQEHEGKTDLYFVTHKVHEWNSRKRELMKPELIEHAVRRIEQFIN